MTIEGVTFLDHTADVGMDVDAASLEELLHRAATGMLALLRGEEDADPAGDPDDASRATPMEIAADSGPALLAAWLREILLLHEVEHRDYASFTAHSLEPWVYGGVVWTRPGGHAVREIKGITYHALEVEERDGRWHARVIFDV